MFEKIIVEKGLRKLNKIGSELSGITVPLPSEKEIIEGIKELENRLDGKVHKSYAKNVIIAYKYSDTHFHYKNKNSLLDDINKNKKIYINSYN